MNTEEFIESVAEMRRLQILYFKTRSKTALKLSKEVEKKIDRFLFDRKQLNLFGNENK
jgi:hypothetical protein